MDEPPELLLEPTKLRQWMASLFRMVTNGRHVVQDREVFGVSEDDEHDLDVVEADRLFRQSWVLTNHRKSRPFALQPEFGICALLRMHH